MTDKRVPREPTPEMIEAAMVGAMTALTAIDKIRAGLIAAYDAAPAAPDERELSDDDLADIARISESATAGLAALRAERDALRAALRKHVIYRAESVDSGPWVMCRICLRKWSALDAERHATGCLAATEDAP